MTMLELLAPARNLETGIAALHSGADAVYIGAPQFGARASAGNSISDIEQLVKLAHLYRARVYITLNTLLHDHEIEAALKIAWQVYEAGADALIIQDPGLLEAGLPPMALHASTQMHNTTPEKVLFLEKTGFKQVVLARELDLDAIRQIRTKTSITLEFFVHGALCVSYSGHCHLSKALTGRSANRGECAQPCRSYYNVVNKKGKILAKNQHILSLKDLNLADEIPALISAGIGSFKIEGRLKDINYVRNITAHYRKIIDGFIEKNKTCRRASSGSGIPDFITDPHKSFNRGFTKYFLHGDSQTDLLSGTPRSRGEYIGSAAAGGPGWFAIKGSHPLFTGDGVVLHNPDGDWTGSRIAGMAPNKILIEKNITIPPGTEVYRNDSPRFEKQVRNSATKRKIAVEACFTETIDGFCLRLTDEDGIDSSTPWKCEKNISNNPLTARANLQSALTRSGNSPFNVKITGMPGEAFHFKIADLNNLRRNALACHEQHRIQAFLPPPCPVRPTSHPYPFEQEMPVIEITNQYALRFYKNHGVDASRLRDDHKINQPLMTTRLCLRHELGNCIKSSEFDSEKDPFLLENQGKKLYLAYDCKKCIMFIHEKPIN